MRPFKRALTSGKADRELLRLKAYYLKIAEMETLEELDHKRWEKYARHEIAQVEEEQATKEAVAASLAGNNGSGGGAGPS